MSRATQIRPVEVIRRSWMLSMAYCITRGVISCTTSTRISITMPPAILP